MSLTATGVVAVGTLLFGRFDDTAGRILGTTGALAVASLLALPAGVLLDQRRYRSLASGTIAAAGAAFLTALWLIWGAGDGGDSGWRMLASFATVAAAGAQISAATARRRGDDSRVVTRLYWTSVGGGLVLATLVLAAIWNEIDAVTYYRFLGAIAVADVVILLLQPTLRRLAPATDRTRLVVSLERTPSREALDAALRALAPYGARLER
jgi:hypothetical protein